MQNSDKYSSSTFQPVKYKDNGHPFSSNASTLDPNYQTYANLPQQASLNHNSGGSPAVSGRQTLQSSHQSGPRGVYSPDPTTMAQPNRKYNPRSPQPHASTLPPPKDRPGAFSPTPGGMVRADKFGSLNIAPNHSQAKISSPVPGVDVRLFPGDRLADANRSPSIAASSIRGDPYRIGGTLSPPFRPSSRHDTANANPRNEDQFIDLRKIIHLLSNEDLIIRQNAAAYLQHLTFQNPDVKERTRLEHGIKPLLDILRSDLPASLSACALGVLRNMSYGNNIEVKKEIHQLDGIPILIHFLNRTSRSMDLQEACTAVLWNLSSLRDTKMVMLQSAVTVLMELVILPHAGGLQMTSEGEWIPTDNQIHWSNVFRNATGVIRNISAFDSYARQSLRETKGLVDALYVVIHGAIGSNEIDNKSVENCVCILRNLCYACQEVIDPRYLLLREQKYRPTANGKNPKSSSTCTSCACAGSSSNKAKKSTTVTQSGEQRIGDTTSGLIQAPPNPNRVPTGMYLLWQLDFIQSYLDICRDSNNPETLEAAAGAIQNLTACDWQPSADIRMQVRKDKGLPILVNLLNSEWHHVVCTAATALRNLAENDRNKELIGKYAIVTLVQYLPDGPPLPPGRTTGNNNSNKTSGNDIEKPGSVNNGVLDTIAAVLALIYTVLKGENTFHRLFVENGGDHRCLHLFNSGIYIYRGDMEIDAGRERVPHFAQQILMLLWNNKELLPRFRENGYKEADFGVTSNALFGGANRSDNNAKSSSNGNKSGGGLCSCGGGGKRKQRRASLNHPTMNKSISAPQEPTNNLNTRTRSVNGEVNLAYDYPTDVHTVRPASNNNMRLDVRSPQATVNGSQVYLMRPPDDYRTSDIRSPYQTVDNRVMSPLAFTPLRSTQYDSNIHVSPSPVIDMPLEELVRQGYSLEVETNEPPYGRVRKDYNSSSNQKSPPSLPTRDVYQLNTVERDNVDSWV